MKLNIIIFLPATSYTASVRCRTCVGAQMYSVLAKTIKSLLAHFAHIGFGFNAKMIDKSCPGFLMTFLTLLMFIFMLEIEMFSKR